ncbi:MAG: polyprenyl synthetase family protein [Erysipelotrichaceae bacterium]|nr:polyprenyl synthetase family protein [Erysipelotrichaceae bacterium]
MNNNFENHIKNYLDGQRVDLILQASEYALEGGKRFRPEIIFAILKGMDIPEEKGYDAAMALEFIQTYSLIHDDLPAMDDDDLRRGKPSLHKAFREDIAILTGDQLLTDSFRIVSESEDYDDETKVNIIKTLSTYAGRDGMIYGQLLDVTSGNKDLDMDKLLLIQENKTAGLFKIACLIPMYIAKLNQEEYFTRLGSMIGHIFQNQDDLFDVIKSEEEMGKNLSDIRNEKLTALQFCDVDGLKKLIQKEFDELSVYLDEASFDTEYLEELLKRLKER